VIDGAFFSSNVLTTGKAPMARWRKVLFSFLGRNSRPPTTFFGLPPNRVVELGLQIELSPARTRRLERAGSNAPARTRQLERAS
jgi:hypothetical protein